MATSLPDGFVVKSVLVHPSVLHIPVLLNREVNEERVEFLRQDIAANGYLRSGCRIVATWGLIPEKDEEVLFVVDGVHRTTALMRLLANASFDGALDKIPVDVLEMERDKEGPKVFMSVTQRLSLGSHYNHIGDLRASVTVIDDLHTVYSALEALKDDVEGRSERKLSEEFVRRKLVGGNKSVRTVRSYIAVVKTLQSPKNGAWILYRTMCRCDVAMKIPLEYLAQGLFRSLQTDIEKETVLMLTSLRLERTGTSFTLKTRTGKHGTVTVPAVSFRTQKGSLLDSMIVMAKVFLSAAASHKLSMTKFADRSLREVVQEENGWNFDATQTVRSYCGGVCASWHNGFPAGVLPNFCRRLHHSSVPLPIQMTMDHHEEHLTKGLHKKSNVSNVDSEKDRNFPVTQAVHGEEEANDGRTVERSGSRNVQPREEHIPPWIVSSSAEPAATGNAVRRMPGVDAVQQPSPSRLVSSPVRSLDTPSRTKDGRDNGENSKIGQVGIEDLPSVGKQDETRSSPAERERNGEKEPSADKRRLADDDVGKETSEEESFSGEQNPSGHKRRRLEYNDVAQEPSQGGSPVVAMKEEDVTVDKNRKALVSELQSLWCEKRVSSFEVPKTQLDCLGFCFVPNYWSTGLERYAMDNVMEILEDTFLFEDQEKTNSISLPDYIGNRKKGWKAEEGLRRISQKTHLWDYVEEHFDETYAWKCEIECTMKAMVDLMCKNPVEMKNLVPGCLVVAEFEGCGVQEPRTTFTMTPEYAFDARKESSFIVLATGRDPLHLFVWPMSHFYNNAGPPYPRLREKRVVIPPYSMYVARADMTWAYAGVPEDDVFAEGRKHAFHLQLLCKHGTHNVDGNVHKASVHRYLDDIRGRRLYGAQRKGKH